jgi:hypothetical protein
MLQLLRFPRPGCLETAAATISSGPASSMPTWRCKKIPGGEVRKSRGIRIPRRGVQHVNFVNLGNPNSGMNSTVFGKMNSSRDARIFQFGLRYDF